MFQQARLKLTAWYLFIIMLITILFSMVIYSVVLHQIRGIVRIQNNRIKKIQDRPSREPLFLPDAPPMMSPQDVELQEEQLRLSLVFIDLGILLFSGAAGYFLAGRTLHPIKLMMDEQNQFISSASHELRTPIATLRAEMEGCLLEKHITEEQSRKLINSNLEELGTLQNLSNSLLTLTKVHSVNGNRQQDIISTLEIINLAHKKISTLAKKKNIHIEKNIKDARIKGDKDSLVELLVVLLDNAIKYSQKDTHITITLEKTQEKIFISIKDEGMGISEGDLPHIFERFFRADKSRSLIEGYGLGLAIAKKEVENHRGGIYVSSELGKGTIFTVWLPLYTSQSE